MPGSKKTKPYASKAQQRKLHAMAERGEISQAEVARKDKATKKKKGSFKSLPKKVRRKK